MLHLSTPPAHIVFIPGFMCDKRLFTPQTRSLSKIGKAYTVEIMTTETTIREAALNILNKSPRRFALAGLSMGGIIALEIMRIAPERVSHLALLNTTPHEDRSLEQRKAHISLAREGGFLNILRDELKPRYLSPATSKSKLMPLISDMGQNLGLDIFIRQSVALIARRSNLSHLVDISCPTLILTGEDDELCPPNIHWEMARHIQNSRLMIIPNCGHISTLEVPEIVTEELFDHWDFHNSNLIPFPVARTRAPETA